MFGLQFENTKLDSIIKNEYEEMVLKYTQNKVHTKEYIMETFEDNITMLPISTSMKSYELLTHTKDSAIPFCTNYSIKESGYNFIKMFKVMTVDTPLTFEEAATFIASYVSKAGNNFYGAILKKGNSLINPFHPLTAIELLKKHESGNKDKYTTILYFYKNRKEADLVYASDFISTSVIDTHLQELLKLSKTEGKSEALCTDIKPDPRKYTLSLEYRTKIKFNDYKNINPIGALGEYYLLAHQVITKGVFYPHYGSSIIKKGTSSSNGISISPFQAVNISAQKSDTIQGNSSVLLMGMCTGGQPQSTRKGLGVLTHCNLSSPLNSECILPGALIYADKCNNLSFLLFYKAGIIKEEVIIPIKQDPETIIKTWEQNKKYTMLSEIIPPLKRKLDEKQNNTTNTTTATTSNTENDSTDDQGYPELI